MLCYSICVRTLLWQWCVLLASLSCGERSPVESEDGKLNFPEGSERLVGSRCYKKRRTFPPNRQKGHGQGVYGADSRLAFVSLLCVTAGQAHSVNVLNATGRTE